MNSEETGVPKHADGCSSNITKSKQIQLALGGDRSSRDTLCITKQYTRYTSVLKSLATSISMI